MSEKKSSSIRARLKNIANNEHKPFDFVLMLYFIERLLYRISVSEYSEQFVLKGGLLLYTIMNELARTTKDIDLSIRQMTNDLDDLRNIFVKIIEIEVDDAIIFDKENITSERIREDADYEGVRIKLTAYLGNVRKTLQFDIGFGDVIVPKPQTMEYPTLLNMPKPIIQAYSKESIIAEKFEAMLYLAGANSRMKDFYDIYSLCLKFNFDGRLLLEAMTKTLTRRGTVISDNPTVFSNELIQNIDKHKQWKAFRRRANVAEGIEFDEVLKMVRKFLKPVFKSIIEETEFFGQWNCELQKW